MKGLIARYKEIGRSRRKTFWFSLVNAIILIMVCYFADNLKYSILSGPSVGQRIEQFKELVGAGTDSILDEYVFINIAYDRQLVSVTDEYGLPKGEIDITNRHKLNELLCQLNNSHKYVMLDVLLSKQYSSDCDSVLVQSILNTERICVSQSSTYDLIDDRLNAKAGYTDYAAHIMENNFVKYEFENDGRPTMPYMAYQTLSGNNPINSLGPIYWSNGHIAWNSLTLRFPIKLWHNAINDNPESEFAMQEKHILNLGSDILEIGIDIPRLVKDKIVVIGDFTEDDIHDTYLGQMAGPVINVNALEALRNKEIEIPWSLIIFLLGLYTISSYQAVRNSISFDDLLRRFHINSNFVKYILSFIGYSFLFAIVSSVIYLISGIDINILIPSLWFSFLSGFTNTVAS